MTGNWCINGRKGFQSCSFVSAGCATVLWWTFSRILEIVTPRDRIFHTAWPRPLGDLVAAHLIMAFSPKLNPSAGAH